MSPSYAIDFRSPLLGFAAACLAVTALALVAPIRDSLLLAGLAGASCLIAVVLAALAKPPVTESH